MYFIGHLLLITWLIEQNAGNIPQGYGRKKPIPIMDIKNMDQAPQNCTGLLRSYCCERDKNKKDDEYVGNCKWSDFFGTGCIFQSTDDFVYVITAAHNIWMREDLGGENENNFCQNHRFYWKLQIGNKETLNEIDQIQQQNELKKIHDQSQLDKGRVLTGNHLERAWIAEQYTDSNIKGFRALSQNDWAVLKYRNTLGVPPQDSILTVGPSDTSKSNKVKLDLPTYQILPDGPKKQKFQAKFMKKIDVFSADTKTGGTKATKVNDYRLYQRDYHSSFIIIGGMSGSPLFNTGKPKQQVAIVSRGGKGAGSHAYMTRITPNKLEIIEQIVNNKWNKYSVVHPANHDNPKLVYPPQPSSSSPPPPPPDSQVLAQMEYMDYMDDRDDGNGYYHEMNPLSLTLWLVFMMSLIFICCIFGLVVIGIYCLCCYCQYKKDTFPQQHIDIESV